MSNDTNTAVDLGGDKPNLQYRTPTEQVLDHPELYEYQVSYEQRVAFREKLMEYFEQTNKRQGAYVWAEQKAIEYFRETQKIPADAWNYRTRRR